MPGKLDDYMRFNETALSLRGKRQEVIASNIANADTPNYKARDVDFASALKSAMGPDTSANAGNNGLGSTGMSSTNAAHIGSAAASAASGAALPDGTPLLFRNPAQGAVDGNTVDMDVERNQFADNSIRYEAGITMISGQIKNMLAAIQAAP